MKVELWNIARVKPYEKNPRHNDEAVDAVAASIKEFGFRQPIVVDTDGVIVCGHTRYKAAIKLGLEKVPVHVAKDLTPAQIKAYRIADNRSAENAEWDYDLLPLEVADLQAMDFDLGLLGFDADELAKMLASEETEGLTDQDATPAPPAEAKSKPGELYVLGRHLLLCGDATKPEDVNRLMEGATAQMCFTDPPWNVAIGQDSNPRHRQREGLENDNLSQEEFAGFLSRFIGCTRDVLDGDLYCVLGAAEWPTLDACLRAEGFHWSATVIWVKDLFVLGRSKYHRRYEPIWYGWHKTKRSSFGGDRTEDDVWEMARPRRSQEHPTMKPVQLVARAIRNSSDLDGLVYEPFGGSGTTLIAAERLGRCCRAVEIDPGFCDVIRRRWAEFVHGEGTDWEARTPLAA